MSRHTAASMRSISETLLYHNKQLILPFEHDLYVYTFTMGIGRECQNFFARAPTSWKKKTEVSCKKPNFISIYKPRNEKFVTQFVKFIQVITFLFDGHDKILIISSVSYNVQFSVFICICQEEKIEDYKTDEKIGQKACTGNSQRKEAVCHIYVNLHLL